METTLNNDVPNVAELIGINDTWIRWRNNTNVEDFNELKTPGLYQIQKDEDTLNAPPTFGIIEVLTGGEKYTIIQRVSDSSGVIYTRGYSSSKGTWSEWTKV